MKALVYGEVLWDIIDGGAHIGGASLNLAAHLARCGDGATLVSRVGTDDLGDRALAELQTLGVDVSRIQRSPRLPTGTVDVTLTADGQPTFRIHRDVAWEQIDLSTAECRDIAAGAFDIFCFGTLAQRGESSRRSLHALLDAAIGVPTFYDVNLRPESFTATIVDRSLQRADIVKINDDEAAELGPMLFGGNLDERALAENLFSRYGASVVVITRGDRGCAVWHAGAFWEHAGRPVTVADAVGAGDAFSAAFLHGYLATGDAGAAAETANHLGAFVASQRGAVPAYTDEIRRILSLEPEPPA